MRIDGRGEGSGGILRSSPLRSADGWCAKKRQWAIPVLEIKTRDKSSHHRLRPCNSATLFPICRATTSMESVVRSGPATSGRESGHGITLEGEKNASNV